MQPLEDLREGLALLEVQPAVIAGGAARVAALAHGVVRRDVIRIGTADSPARADRQRRVEATLDLPDIEFNGVSLCADPHGYCCGQQMRLVQPAHFYSCHAVLRMRMC
ncbi:hypothetical protein D3C81_1263270 [compost metagenome]